MLSIAPAATSQVESISFATDIVSKPVIGNDISFFSLFLQADLVVKVVMLLLLLASISSWAIIIEKYFKFIKTRFKMNDFERRFWSGKSLEALLQTTTQKKEKHMLAQIFTSAMQELSTGNSSSMNFIKDRLDQSIRVALNKGVEEIESGIGILATMSNSAPFVGLFGTVWGIMTSFQSIAASKNTSLAIVAPGIAEALLATAFGLIVAIPAAIFYNKFSSDINKMVIRAENFSLELSNLVIRDIDIDKR